MNHLIRRSLYAANVVLVAGLAGCASDLDTGASDDAEVSSTSTPLLTIPTKPLITVDGEGCLISPAGKSLMQKKVTTAFNYVIGGNNKFLVHQYPCTEPDGSATAVMERLTQLKTMVDEGTVIWGDVNKTTVCGLPAAERELHGAAHIYDLNSLRAWNIVQQIGVELDRCWGPGASKFTYLGNDGKTVKIDPEPAQLTQSLSGSTGATAAAVYVNSQSPTNVVKWFSSYYYNPGLAAGTPCSTVNLASSSETLKVIVASGSMKRCF